MSPVPAFHEEWFPEASQRVLGQLVAVADKVPGTLVEFGSWEGRSTVALAQAAYPRSVHAVDTWQGSPGEPSAVLAAQRDVFAQFQANITQWTKGNVVPFVMGWREYLAAEREPIAMAFIDAEHSYREVFDNIAEVLPLLSPGGVICGDDAHHPPVMQAVRDHFGEVETAATLWIWTAP